MSVKPGRNDPCHCGSGKKYKRCHLAADEAREHEAATARAMGRAADLINAFGGGPLPILHNAPAPGVPPIDFSKFPGMTPEMQAENEAYEAFHQRWLHADYPTQLQLFDEQLRTGITYDIIDMIATLFEGSREHNDRDRFWAVVEQFQQAAPDVAAGENVWLLSYLVEDSVTRGLYERLPGLVDRLADAAPQSVDEMFRLLDMLLFHGQSAIALQIMTRAWPALSVTRGITPYGLGEFVGLLAMLQIAEYAARTPAPSPDDRALLDLLEPLGMLDREGIALALASLTSPGRTWAATDFRHDPGAHDQPRGESGQQEDGRWPDDDAATIDDLLLHPDDYSDDELAEILGLDDEDGDGEADEGPLPGPVTVSPVGVREPGESCAALHRHLVALTVEWAAHAARELALPYARVELARDILIAYLDEQPPGKHDQAPLPPARRPVEQFVNAYLSPLSGRYYKGAAFYALLPSYVSFLEAKGLTTRDLGRRALNDLRYLHADVRRICEEAAHDPLLTGFIDQMWA